MKLERILELAQTAPTAIQLPQELIAFIRESLQKSLSENQLKKFYPILSEYRKELIHFATSDFIKTRKKARTIKEITQVLPAEWIRDVILLHWFGHLEPSRPNEPLDYHSFYHHVILLFYFAQELKRYVDNQNQKTVGLYALFSQFHSVVLSRHAPEMFQKLNEKTEPPPAHSRRTTLPDFSPYQLTQQLLDNWGFPPEFTRAIGELGKPIQKTPRAGDAKIAGVLHLADQIAHWYRQQHRISFRHLQEIAQHHLQIPEKELFKILREGLTRLPQFLEAIQYPTDQLSDPFLLLLRDETVVQKKLITYEELAAAYISVLQQIPANESPQENESLEIQYLDETTNTHNHTYFHLLLQDLLAQSVRYEFPVSIILMDIDEFKLLNEVHGHLIGDAVLQQVATLLKSQLRKADVICRIGPDEFGIILSHTGLLHAHHVAEKIRRKIEAHPFMHPTRDQTYPVTVSIAYITFTSDGTYSQKNDLLEAGRRALIRAKIRGGNQCLEGKL